METSSNARTGRALALCPFFQSSSFCLKPQQCELQVRDACRGIVARCFLQCIYVLLPVQHEILGTAVEHSQFHWEEVGSFLTSDSMCLPSSLMYCIDAVSNVVTLEGGLLYHLLLRGLA